MVRLGGLGWTHRALLGASDYYSWSGMSRTLQQLVRQCGEGARKLIENDGACQYRLVIDPTGIELDHEGLLAHPCPGVREALDRWRTNGTL